MLQPCDFLPDLQRAKGQRALITEDAPRKTRVGYVKGVLDHFVGTKSRWDTTSKPLDAQEVHEAFIALIRDGI